MIRRAFFRRMMAGALSAWLVRSELLGKAPVLVPWLDDAPQAVAGTLRLFSGHPGEGGALLATCEIPGPELTLPASMGTIRIPLPDGGFQFEAKQDFVLGEGTWIDVPGIGTFPFNIDALGGPRVDKGQTVWMPAINFTIRDS